MSESLRRLIPQARMLITKESFRDQSFGNLDGYIEDILRPIDIAPLISIVQTAMKIFPSRDEESDGWLAPRVHASLRLFRSEAADQGIWDYISVVALRDYVIWRMADEDGLVNDIDRIIGPFRHQAVARLWWAAELSRNGADYLPTQEAFSSQDAVNYLTNIDAFHNRPAALAYIRFISHRSGDKPIKQRAIETGKTLNHVLTTIVLDSFAPDSGGDMSANERWIAETPDIALMDSALPQGPDEPQVQEEKISAVEQLLERLMDERHWTEVMDWGEKWIVKAQSTEPAENTLPIIASPDGNGSKGAVANDQVAQDAEQYERFVQALRDDLDIEPSAQTRDLFAQVSNELDKSHTPDGSTIADHVEELSKDEKITDAMLASELADSPAQVPSNESLVQDEPLLADSPERGNAQAAIIETAEKVYEELSPAQQILARRIFLQLTELGEGTLDTPRNAIVNELILRSENALPVEAMLKMLKDAHLITWDETAVRLADETLIREWKRLREWLDADREGLRLHRHLAQATQEWEMMQRDSGALYRGARLAQALEWAQTNANEISEREREFLDVSNQVAESEEQSLAEAETRRAEKEHRAAMQWRQRALYLAAALIIVPIIVAVVGYFVH